MSLLSFRRCHCGNFVMSAELCMRMLRRLQTECMDPARFPYSQEIIGRALARIVAQLDGQCGACTELELEQGDREPHPLDAYPIPAPPAAVRS